MAALIPGLPDELAILCLAYVPYCQRGNPHAVSRGWRSAFKSEELFTMREENGLLEELLCVESTAPDADNAPAVVFRALDLKRHVWVRLPLLQQQNFEACREDSELYCRSFWCTGIRNRLIILGGPVWDDGAYFLPNPQVFYLDTARSTWVQMSSMTVPRARGFAAGVLDGEIVVAGGKNNQTAEAFSLVTGKWRPLPSLPPQFADHAGPGHWGIVVNQSLYIMPLDGPSNDTNIPTLAFSAQGLRAARAGGTPSAAAAAAWTPAKSFWRNWPWHFDDFGWARSEDFALLHRSLYTVRSKERGRYIQVPEIVRYDVERGTWDVVTTVPGGSGGGGPALWAARGGGRPTCGAAGWQQPVVDDEGRTIIFGRCRPEGGGWFEAQSYVVTAVQAALAVIESGMEYARDGKKLESACFWSLLSFPEWGRSVGLEGRDGGAAAALRSGLRRTPPAGEWTVVQQRCPDRNMSRGISPAYF